MDEITKNNLGNRLAIVLESQVNSAPILQDRISNGQARITLKDKGKSYNETLKEAQDLSVLLKTGSLPASIVLLEEKKIGPSLGLESIYGGVFAFVFGSLLVAIFMISYYKISGVFSVFAVMYNLIVMLALLAWLNVTMTLPGIAGLLLTFAMAVDANIIINERIREELRNGKKPFDAVRIGYQTAFTAVFDSHSTSILSGFILWGIGTGPVQNFAITLIIGTVLSLITAVYVTRMFFDIFVKEHTKRISI